MSLPSVSVLLLLLTACLLLMVLAVSIVDTSGVADVCSSVLFGLGVVLFCIVQNPGNMLRAEPKILAIVPGLFALFTKNSAL